MAITIDEDVFACDPGGDNARQTLRVGDVDDLERARLALMAAAERFRRVDGFGVEHDEADESWQERPGVAGHSCKYVSDITVDDDGTAVSVWLDCQSVIPPAMGEALARVVVEELARHGVRRAVLTSPVLPAEDREVPSWVKTFSPDGRALPVGFPPAVPFPPGSEVVGTDADTMTGTTRIARHNGSWKASVLLAVDDEEAAFAFYREQLPQAGFEVRDETPFQHPAGHRILSIHAVGAGVEIEVGALDAATAARGLPGFRKRKGKAAVAVDAFQRDPDPGPDPGDWP